MRADPGHISYAALTQNIINGFIKIPQFQRDFVWSIDDSAKLIDSIIKGYPIGTFIIWKTKERLRSVKSIGGIDFPDTPAGDMVKYVLDGQQRITSIFAALNGVSIIRDEKAVDYSQIYIDLEATADDTIVTTDTEKNPNSLLKVVSLLNASLTEIFAFTTTHPHIPDALDKIQSYQNAINQYLFSTITVEDAPLDIATEIFTRINIGGKPLNNFEIMVAKTYDEVRNFDLSEKFESLISELQNSDYDTISSSTVLQSISLCINNDVRSRAILSLNKEAFIDAWEPVTKALKNAVDYFRSAFVVPVSNLLPYEALLVLFTYYFYKHADRPVGNHQLRLADYFWRAIISERFSSSADTKMNSDAAIIDSIITDAKSNVPAVDLSFESFKMKGYFSTSSAFIKGILCILAAQNPVSFKDGTKVTVDNSWLVRSNSKNYHHFFPKAFMRNNHLETDDWPVNHIANITIVDDYLNKREIKDTAPSIYIQRFALQNQNLEQALASHLITYNATDDSGINSNDYETFFKKRLNRIIGEFKTRIILTDSDRVN